MKPRLILALLVGACAASPTKAQQPLPLPPDLAAVPADALGFVHVRVADVWKSDAIKELRETVLKAGAKALENFDARFVPHPSTIERLTVVALAQDPELQADPLVYAALALNKPFDKDALLKSARAVIENAKTGSIYVNEKDKWAVTFLNDQTIAFGQIPAIRALRQGPVKGDGPLASALRQANSKRHFTLAGNLTYLPEKFARDLPPAVRPLLAAQSAIIGIDMAEPTLIEMALNYAAERQANDAEAAIKDLAKLGRVFVKKSRAEMLAKALGDGKPAPLDEFPEAAMALLAVGSLERIDGFLADPPVKRDGAILRASFELPGGSAVLGIGVTGASIASVYTFRYLEEAKKEKAQLQISTLNKAVQTYMLKNDGAPPESLDQVSKFLDGGNAALLDPWGKKYQYSYEGDRIMIQTTAPDGAVITNTRPKR